MKQTFNLRFFTPVLSAVSIELVVIATCVYCARAADAPPPDRRYEPVFESVMAARPSGVDVSPNGQYIVTKEEDEGGFRLRVFDCISKHFTYTPVSKNTQYGLSWRPDSKAFVYQESSGLDRPLCLVDLTSGKSWHPDVPVSHSALLPAQWSPDGKFLAYFDGDWRGGRLLIFDPNAGDKPHVIQDGVTPGNADFAWSPDSTAIAVAATGSSGTIVIKDLAGKSCGQLNIGSEIRNVAWSWDRNFILTTVRAPGDEFFRLVRVDIKRGQVLPLANGAGDICSPLCLHDDKSFLYQLSSNGISKIVFSGLAGEKRVIGPTNGNLEPTHLSSDGKYVYGRYADCAQPLSLVQISLDDGNYRQIYSPPRSSEVICPPPNLIRLRSEDSMMIPAYYWHAGGETNVPCAALIVVHGGPHDHIDAGWSPLPYLMLKRGCDVIAVNYRGSSGFGQSFERMGTDSERAWDVLAARDYAVDFLKIAPRNVFLLGNSYGAPLAAYAAGEGEQIGGLILVSWPRSIEDINAHLHLNSSLPIIEFHGADDPILSPDAASFSIREFLESAGASDIEPRQIVFKDEGHFFDKESSLAREYWLTIKMMGLD